jgi:hypothetical protein
MILTQNNRNSSREVEGHGPMKPGNPPAFDAGMVPIPANTVRKMRGISITL